MFTLSCCCCCSSHVHVVLLLGRDARCRRRYRRQLASLEELQQKQSDFKLFEVRVAPDDHFGEVRAFENLRRRGAALRGETTAKTAMLRASIGLQVLQVAYSSSRSAAHSCSMLEASSMCLPCAIGASRNGSISFRAPAFSCNCAVPQALEPCEYVFIEHPEDVEVKHAALALCLHRLRG